MADAVASPRGPFKRLRRVADAKCGVSCSDIASAVGQTNAEEVPAICRGAEKPPGMIVRSGHGRRFTVAYPNTRSRQTSISWSRAGGEEAARQIALQLLECLRRGGSTEDALQLKESLLTRCEKQAEPPKRVRARAYPRSGSAAAEERARELLAEAGSQCDDGHQRRITDHDVLQVLRLWKFRKNTQRVNVMRAGETSVLSEMLGLVLTRAYCKCDVAAATRAFPSVTKLLCRYIRDNPPDGLLPGECFPFTTICINKGYAAARHRDNHNIGISVVKALGSFEGGRLWYWPSDTLDVVTTMPSHGPANQRRRRPKLPDVDALEPCDACLLDVRERFCYVDGRRAHEVEDFMGERYSLVYFTITSQHLFDRGSRKRIHELYGLTFTEPKVWSELACRLQPEVDRQLAAAAAKGAPRRGRIASDSLFSLRRPLL